MPKQRSPERDKAFDIYINHKGKIALREIANQLGIPEKTVSGWKSKDNWDAVLFKNNTEYAEKIRSTPKKELTPKMEQKEIKVIGLDTAELTEKQKLFCLYYIKSFNATMAAIKAGYAKDRAHVTGSELVRNSKVAAEIKRLKGELQQDIFIDVMDVLNKYIKIAFADITDFVKFGFREEPVIKYGQQVTDARGKPVTIKYSYVDLRESDMVDGALINEVAQGKDGIKIKLADKMKALDKLAEYFDLFPDKFKRRIEEEKLSLLRRKTGDDEPEEIEDDGFIEALSAESKKVWDDEED